MDVWLHSTLSAWLAWLSIPQVGLSGVFVIALVSATLLPMGSEPAVFALVKVQPDLFWTVIVVATAGNTLGGAISWWMGRGAARAHRAWQARRQGLSQPETSPATQADATTERARRWMAQWGPRACLVSWLPVVGDPLCAAAGWLNLPFWPCVFYMAVGKFLRYAAATALLSAIF
jgi:membrane protein YqaA with SNARE-associated domain